MLRFYKKNIFYFAVVAMIAIVIQVRYLNYIIGFICRICPNSDIGGIMLTILYFVLLLFQAVPIIQSLAWILWSNRV